MTFTLDNKHTGTYTQDARHTATFSNDSKTNGILLWAFGSFPWQLALPWQTVSGNLTLDIRN